MQEHYGAERQAYSIDTRLDLKREATATLFLKLSNGVEIAVPNNLSHITTYVIAEQETWFESELDYWGQALEPGAFVFDVGANHGVYALSLAPVVEPEGRLIAFEPGAGAFSYLRRGVEHGEHKNIELRQIALAAEAGSGHLHGDAVGGITVHENLTLKAGKGRQLEEVEISTLDLEWQRLNRPMVDFVKLDVEYMELEVLNGSTEMIKACAPMIMFEVSGEQTPCKTIGEWLQAKGYDLYRHLPAMNILVPLVIGELSRYQLNVVAMPRSRAKSLAQRDLLVLEDEAEHVVQNDIWTLIEIPEKGWPDSLTSLPSWKRYGQLDDGPKSRIDMIRHGNQPNPYREALWLAAAAIDPNQPLVVRYTALRQACAMTTEFMQNDAAYRQSLTKLWTTARLAWMCGFRELATDALGHAGRLLNRPPAVFSEPFLPALPRFDDIDPGEDLVDWAAMMTIESLITLNSHSSRFTKGEALPALERW
ncbi:MAG: FkbM family methyltransferase, partial [Pseudomonadota bacterium]